MSFSKFIKSNINLYSVNLFFLIGSFIVLSAHVFFLTGLNEDGAFNLTKLILSNEIFFFDNLFETQRKIFNTLHKLPVWLFLNFSQSQNIHLLTRIYSFSLIYIHIIALVGCYLILPKNQKKLIFFPLFAFLTGPMAVFGISVSVALSVCSYIWLTVFVIYYSDLSIKTHKIIFCLVPLPLFLSHELMVYMTWPLIALCFLKDKKELKSENKFLIRIMIGFLIMIAFFYFSFLLSTNDIDTKHNLSQFKTTIFYLKFLFSNSKINLFIITALVLKFLLCTEYHSKNKKKILQKISLFLLVVSFLITVLLPFSLYNQFFFIKDHSARSWPPVLSLPLGLLLWWIYEKKALRFKNSKIFLFSCLIFLITSVVYRVKQDLHFYNHQKQFSEKLEKCKGIIKWSSVKSHFYSIENYKFLEEQLWKISAVSLIFPAKRNIYSIIIDDKCIDNCLERIESTKKCATFCQHVSFNIPHSLFDSSLNNRFFNFQSLMKNIANNQSVCKK